MRPLVARSSEHERKGVKSDRSANGSNVYPAPAGVECYPARQNAVIRRSFWAAAGDRMETAPPLRIASLSVHRTMTPTCTCCRQLGRSESMTP